MRRGPTVLVVDDHLDTLEMLSRYLTANGCTVLTATDGAEALDLARAEKPSVVLLDLMMPKVSGLEVAMRIREGAWLPGARLVATTGMVSAADRERALEYGFDEVLTKPYDITEILRIVRSE